jgi:dienelactone hydrolase
MLRTSFTRRFRISNPLVLSLSGWHAYAKLRHGRIRKFSLSQQVRFYTLVLVLLCGWVSLLPAAEIMPTSDPVLQGQCGRGALWDIAGRRVLLVAGSPYEMGYQQGYLLKTEVRALVNTVLTVAQAAGSEKFSGGIENAWLRTGKFIPRRFLEEMQGLADGAGVPLEQVQLANIFPELFHCSGFALFGKATRNGRLLHGRILDYMTEAGLQNFAVLTIAKPNNCHTFVTVGYAGFLGSVTGMNDQQVAIGEMGGRGEGKWDGMPMTFLVRQALEKADTLQQALDIFQNTPRTCEYYYVISDGKNSDARGLACTPETMQTISPGQNHPLLPHGMTDTVLMSAGDRYEHLAGLVKKQYGKIDLDAALDLMNRPVAMESCLHRVLFSPAELKLWVSDAAPATRDRFAACYQPYYRYDMKTLVSMIPDTAPASATKIPQPTEEDIRKSRTPAAETISIPQINISGTVSKSVTRTIPPARTPKQEKYLKTYRRSTSEFPYQIKTQKRTYAYDVMELSFPSPITSEIPENNRVYCEYYRKPENKKHSVVILLDILDGSMMVPRIIAHGLASNGIDACIMVMPHFGARRSLDKAKQREMLSNPENLVSSIQQAVGDVRRTARCLSTLDFVDTNRIGICGVSMGGFITALSAGVDGNFKRVAVIMAGGDLATVLTTNSKEASSIRRVLEERNLTGNALQELLASIEPLTYADRLRSAKLLMVNGSTDTIVPPACARKLAEAVGAEIHWYPTDHYGMVKYLLPTMGLIQQHFADDTW